MKWTKAKTNGNLRKKVEVVINNSEHGTILRTEELVEMFKDRNLLLNNKRLGAIIREFSTLEKIGINTWRVIKAEA